jgi:catalase
LTEPPIPILENAWIKAYDTQDDDNFSQAGALFRLMSDSQKDQLTNNIAGGLRHATASVQERMLAQFEAADPNYAALVKEKLSP